MKMIGRNSQVQYNILFVNVFFKYYVEVFFNNFTLVEKGVFIMNSAKKVAKNHLSTDKRIIKKKF